MSKIMLCIFTTQS